MDYKKKYLKYKIKYLNQKGYGDDNLKKYFKVTEFDNISNFRKNINENTPFREIMKRELVRLLTINVINGCVKKIGGKKFLNYASNGHYRYIEEKYSMIPMSIYNSIYNDYKIANSDENNYQYHTIFPDNKVPMYIMPPSIEIFDKYVIEYIKYTDLNILIDKYIKYDKFIEKIMNIANEIQNINVDEKIKNFTDTLQTPVIKEQINSNIKKSCSGFYAEFNVIDKKYNDMMDKQYISMFVFNEKQSVDINVNTHFFIVKNLLYVLLDFIGVSKQIKHSSIIMHSYCSYHFNENYFMTSPIGKMADILEKYLEHKDIKYVKLDSLSENTDNILNKIATDSICVVFGSNKYAFDVSKNFKDDWKSLIKLNLLPSDD